VQKTFCAVAGSVIALVWPMGPRPLLAEGDLHRVKHIIIVMQENHSFNNYFGVLPYVPGGPYHRGPCRLD
jgi:phospholipase C